MDQPAADWQGEVEHIQSGRRWIFGTLDDLLVFLRRQADDPGVLCQPAGSEPNSLRRKNRVKSRR
jgi:hypothetical protein